MKQYINIYNLNLLLKCNVLTNINIVYTLKDKLFSITNLNLLSLISFYNKILKFFIYFLN